MSRCHPLLVFGLLSVAATVLTYGPRDAVAPSSAHTGHAAKKKRHGKRRRKARHGCAAKRARAARRHCLRRAKYRRRVWGRCGRPRHRRGWSRRDLDGDRVPNRRDRDVDSDHRKNRRDCDVDGDGLLNCGSKRGGVGHPEDRDIDADRIRNQRDRDMDGDGIANFEDDDSDTSGDPVDSSVPSLHLPRSFFGVVSGSVASKVGPARERVMNEVDSTGVGTLRLKAEWSQIEKSPGVYDFRGWDGLVRDVTRRGFSILPILFDPPSFRSSEPAAGASGTWPPRSADEFAAFATIMVRRYGPNGNFWHANPDVPYRPLRAWQIWNEPHIKAYWPSGPNAAEYVAMARPVAAAIKRADPGAEVVAAAISESNIGVPMAEYLEAMYAAGAAPVFDTIAIHPYAGAADLVFDLMDRIRWIADSHGDASARIWMTELGWATSGPVSPYNVGEHGQTELIRRVWAVLVRNRDRLKLRGMIYFNWQDLPPYAPKYQDFFGLHTGLHRLDGSRKPAFDAFSRVVRKMVYG